MGTNEHGIVRLPKLTPSEEEGASTKKDPKEDPKEDPLAGIRDLLERIHKDVGTLSNRIGDLEKRQEKTEEQQKDLTHEVKKLTAHIGMLQVETRKNNVQLAAWNQTCAARCDAVNVIVKQLHETTKNDAEAPVDSVDDPDIDTKTE